MLCIPKILKNESNSQQYQWTRKLGECCCVSQRYWKMKAIHNKWWLFVHRNLVVVYPKDTEKWKQFTTALDHMASFKGLLCIPKILKNESNSQQRYNIVIFHHCCCVSQRYWKMKAIHNSYNVVTNQFGVVVYPKDTEKWKQFTTFRIRRRQRLRLLCIPKILKNESNSQL